MSQPLMRRSSMDEILLAGSLGALGGCTRGVLGLFKALTKKKKINYKYWWLTLAISIIIGVFTGIVFSFDYRLALLAGYAGTDILEGVYKVFSPKKIYVPERSAFNY